MIRISILRLKQSKRTSERSVTRCTNDKNLNSEIETSFRRHGTEISVSLRMIRISILRLKRHGCVIPQPKTSALRMIRISILRLKHGGSARSQSARRDTNDKNLNSEIETPLRFEGHWRCWPTNDKNLNSEIETIL